MSRGGRPCPCSARPAREAHHTEGFRKSCLQGTWDGLAAGGAPRAPQSEGQVGISEYKAAGPCSCPTSVAALAPAGLVSCSGSGLKGSSGASGTLQGRAAPWTLGSCREGGGPGPAHQPTVTFSTQQVPVHVTHPEQGEASGEVEDTLPAVPVQQQGAHGPSYQCPGGQGRAWPWPRLHPTAQEVAENAHPAAAWALSRMARAGRSARGRWVCEEPRTGRGSGTDAGAPMQLLTSCFQAFELGGNLPSPFSSLIREDKLPDRALSIATVVPEPKPQPHGVP